MATHSSTLAWKILWTEEPGGLQSMESRRVGHDWATSLSRFTFMHWRRKWQPTPVFLPGESQGRGAWWAAVYGVSQSRTRLKRLSSNSIIRLGIFYLPCFCIFFLLTQGQYFISSLLEKKHHMAININTQKCLCQIHNSNAKLFFFFI